MSAQQLKNAFIELFKGISELSKCKKNNSFYDFSCTLFCPLGQNEFDIKKCAAQIPFYILRICAPRTKFGAITA